MLIAFNKMMLKAVVENVHVTLERKEVVILDRG